LPSFLWPCATRPSSNRCPSDLQTNLNIHSDCLETGSWRTIIQEVEYTYLRTWLLLVPLTRNSTVSTTMSALNDPQYKEAHATEKQTTSSNELSETSESDSSASHSTPSQAQHQSQTPMKTQGRVNIIPPTKPQPLPTTLPPCLTTPHQPTPIAPMSFTPQPQSQAQSNLSSSQSLLPSDLCLRGGCTDDCCDCCGCYHGSSNLAPRRQGSLVWYGHYR